MIDHFVARETTEAAAIHRHLVPLFRDLFVVSNPIPLKFALNHIGFRVGGYRLPLTEPDRKTQDIILSTLDRYHIDLPV
jgi:4-hydroxy-tetrahydrodipicolinate synthase